MADTSSYEHCARNAPAAAAAKRIDSLPRVNKTTKTLYMMWRHYEMHDLICLTKSITELLQHYNVKRCLIIIIIIIIIVMMTFLLIIWS